MAWARWRIGSTSSPTSGAEWQQVSSRRSARRGRAQLAVGLPDAHLGSPDYGDGTMATAFDALGKYYDIEAEFGRRGEGVPHGLGDWVVPPPHPMGDKHLIGMFLHGCSGRGDLRRRAVARRGGGGARASSLRAPPPTSMPPFTTQRTMAAGCRRSSRCPHRRAGGGQVEGLRSPRARHLRPTAPPRASSELRVEVLRGRTDALRMLADYPSYGFMIPPTSRRRLE